MYLNQFYKVYHHDFIFIAHYFIILYLYNTQSTNLFPKLFSCNFKLDFANI